MFKYRPRREILSSKNLRVDHYYRNEFRNRLTRGTVILWRELAHVPTLNVQSRQKPTQYWNSPYNSCNSVCLRCFLFVVMIGKREGWVTSKSGQKFLHLSKNNLGLSTLQCKSGEWLIAGLIDKHYTDTFPHFSADLNRFNSNCVSPEQTEISPKKNVSLAGLRWNEEEWKFYQKLPQSL